MKTTRLQVMNRTFEVWFDRTYKLWYARERDTAGNQIGEGFWHADRDVLHVLIGLRIGIGKEDR